MGFNTYPGNPWPLPSDQVGGSDYVLPTASADTLGGVKVGSGLSIADEVLSAEAYTLPTASADTLGGVKVGDNLTIADGVLSAAAYTLPTASAETLGGVKVGSGLAINDGVLSVAGGSGTVLYGGEKTNSIFTMPEGVSIIPFLDHFAINSGTGAGTGHRVYYTTNKIDLTDFTNLHIEGLFNQLVLGDFINADFDITAVTGEKYLVFGYNYTTSYGELIYCISDTDNPDVADYQTIQRRTTAAQGSLINKIILS